MAKAGIDGTEGERSCTACGGVGELPHPDAGDSESEDATIPCPSCGGSGHAQPDGRDSAPKAFSLDELQRAVVETISDEVDATPAPPMKIYHCEDCGSRIAMQILNGPTEPMPHHYLAAGGGEPFIGNCPICGGTNGHNKIRKAK